MTDNKGLEGVANAAVVELIGRLRQLAYATKKVNGTDRGCTNGEWSYIEKREELDGKSCADIDDDLEAWSGEQLYNRQFTVEEYNNLHFAICCSPETEQAREILDSYINEEATLKKYKAMLDTATDIPEEDKKRYWGYALDDCGGWVPAEYHVTYVDRLSLRVILHGYEDAMGLIEYLDTQLYHEAEADQWPVAVENVVRGKMNSISHYLEGEFEAGRDEYPSYLCHDFHPEKFLKPVPARR